MDFKPWLKRTVKGETTFLKLVPANSHFKYLRNKTVCSDFNLLTWKKQIPIVYLKEVYN
jgi:hypothetical protein